MNAAVIVDRLLESDIDDPKEFMRRNAKVLRAKIEHPAYQCNGEACGRMVEPNDPYYSTPCGTYCNDCMRRHIEGCDVCRHEFADEFGLDLEDDNEFPRM